ncbi:MAG: PQQ-binding-like beta-propeller repeat protein [Candidatus Hadarchaeaceae archaeon]
MGMKFGMVIVVVLVVALVVPPLTIAGQSSEEWPTFHGNWARTGYIDAELSDNLGLLWEFPGEWGVLQSKSTPAIADGKVYFTAYKTQEDIGHIFIFALDAENGELVWNYRAGRDAGASDYPSPTVVDGRVYVGDENYLYAFDAESGELIWRFEVPWEGGLHGVDSSPVVIDNRVYFGSWDGWFYCLDANTGELIWAYSDGDGKMGHAMEAPAFSDGIIYFGTGAGAGSPIDYTGWVYALNAQNGDLIWKFQIGDEIGSSPAVVDNIVYIGAGFMGHLPGDGMWAFDAHTGELIWYFDTENESVGCPAVAHGKVYFQSNDRYLYALDAKNGSIVWKYYTDTWAWSPPIVIGDKVVIGNGELHVLDAENGDLISLGNIGGGGYAPAFAYGKIYITTWSPGGIQVLGAPSTPPKEESLWWLLPIGVVLIIGAIAFVWRKIL